jgi:hypothetical protein
MESQEKHYRLYLDGETNFTLQAPDNTTIAVFSVKTNDNKEEIYYKACFTDLRNHASKEPKIVYYGQDKESAINAARGAARYFIRTLDDKFEDKTEIEHLLKQIREDDLSFVPQFEIGEPEESPRVGSDE